MFKHILIPTDGSPIAIKAVRAGIRFAHEIGAKVTAYQAIGTLLTHIDEEGYVVDPKMHDAFERTARETAQRRLDAIGKLARTAGVTFNSAVTIVDTPYKGIIDAAKKHKCDVIFMALAWPPRRLRPADEQCHPESTDALQDTGPGVPVSDGSKNENARL